MKETKAKNLKYYVCYLLILFLFSCSKCKQPFEPNPNLRLLLREEGYNLGNPVWTKSGWIYYTKQKGPELGEWYGDIWRIKEDGTQNDLVLSGYFFSFDVSPGETLIAGIEKDYRDIQLFNLNTMVLDTLRIFPYKAVKVFFGNTDSFLYYLGKKDTFNDYITKIWRYNLLTHQKMLILKGKLSLIDVYKDSLICYYSEETSSYYFYVFSTQNRKEVITGGKIYPKNPNYILKVHNYSDFKEDLKLVHTLSGDEKFLNVRPYEKGIFDGICFAPDGSKIVFSFDEAYGGDPIRYDYFELWILEKF